MVFHKPFEYLEFSYSTTKVTVVEHTHTHTHTRLIMTKLPWKSVYWSSAGIGMSTNNVVRLHMTLSEESEKEN